jgi:anaphase-promoting complex subunit 4
LFFPYHDTNTLLSSDKSPAIARLPITEEIVWLPHEQNRVPAAIPITEVAPQVEVLRIPTEDGFEPVQMEVLEESDARGFIPSRVCLLGSDRATYRVFALEEEGRAVEGA